MCVIDLFYVTQSSLLNKPLIMHTEDEQMSEN